MEHNKKHPAANPKLQKQTTVKRKQAPSQETAERTRTGEQRNGNVVPLRQKKKKRNKSGIITLAILLVIAVIFLFGPTVIKTVTGSMSSTDILKNGVLENSFRTQAVIVRDETVLQSAVSGTCISTYEEGEKVPNGATVATVINSDSQALVEQIKSLNVRISQAREDMMSNADFVNEEIQKVESSISQYKAQLSKLYATGDLTAYASVYQNIGILLDQKADLKNVDVSSSSYLKQLLAEKAVVENALKGKMENVVNTVSGVVSYAVDGFETELNSAMLDHCSPETFTDIVKRIEKGKDVPANDCVKIVTGVNYYFLFTTKYDNVSGMRSGSSVDVRINEKNMIVTMEVHSITLHGKDALVVLKANSALSELTQLRKTEIDIITAQVSGIKVPQKALLNVNYIENTGKIALVKSGYAYYVDVHIVYKNGEYAIIENKNPDGAVTFSVNDFIVIDPAKIKEGQVVG